VEVDGDHGQEEASNGGARLKQHRRLAFPSPKLLGGGTPLAALTWVFANSKVMSSGYMV
jgi:hypothetical protein